MRDHIACSSSSRLVKDLRSIDGTLRSICSLRFWSTPSRSLVASSKVSSTNFHSVNSVSGDLSIAEVKVPALKLWCAERRSLFPQGHHQGLDDGSSVSGDLEDLWCAGLSVSPQDRHQGLDGSRLSSANGWY